MPDRPSIITLGNFDGVHLGHRALLQAAGRHAREVAGGADVVALTFQTSPATVLRPDEAAPVLMEPAEKMAALLDAGADRIEWLQPTEELLSLEPDAFVRRMVDLLKPLVWVEGSDFRFGRQRAGDVGALATLGERMGFRVEVVEPVEVVLRDKCTCAVSSSLIRWLLAGGRVCDAAAALGRPPRLRGEVVSGEKGRTIGFPTANLDVGRRQLPADGVYGGQVGIGAEQYLAAISIGTKPTFGAQPRVAEVYVLDYDGDLYGQTLEVELLRWLRGQLSFEGVESLISQMHRDVSAVREYAAMDRLDPGRSVERINRS